MYSDHVQNQGWLRAPLIYVVAQCLTDPNHRLEQQQAALQIELGAAGFTARAERKVQRITFNPQQGVVKTDEDTLFEYAKPDQSFVVLIGKSQIEISTSTYQRFEIFHHEFTTALNAVSRATVQEGETHLVRVGLRYLDWIKNHPEMSLDDQIEPRFHPPLEHASERVTGVLQLQLQRNDINLLYQSMTGLHAKQHLGFFAGVRPSIKKLERFDPNDTAPFEEVICDFDTYKEFDIQWPRVPLLEACRHLEELHSYASKKFLRAVKSEAISFYKGEHHGIA